jgi:hypothetical protein
MSTINTNGLDVNYPVPGVNNNSQGFRNNFTNIKQNLDIAYNEITDLQDSVVLKNALGNATINNDMGNVLISNASTLNFRATTYNLGSALVGQIVVDMSLADVHYGTLAGNVILNFGNWAPTGTLGKVTLQLSTSNVANNYSISLPGQVIFSNDNSGAALINNFVDANGVGTITFPNNCTELDLECYSTDCGNTIYITPINRPYQSVQIQTRTPASTGDYGDMSGTVCVDPAAPQLLITTTYSNDYILTSNTSSLYVGMPVSFTASTAGVSTEANITLGTTYYVSNVDNANALFKISTYSNVSSNVNLAGNVASMYVNPISYMYVATDDFNATLIPKNIANTTSPNIITFTSSANLTGVTNCPIMFTGTYDGNVGLQTETIYYIKSVSGSNVTVSQTRYNGVAGPEFTGISTVASANLDISDANIYVGSDIFRRIPLQPF